MSFPMTRNFKALFLVQLCISDSLLKSQTTQRPQAFRKIHHLTTILAKHGFRCLPVDKSLGKKRLLVCFPWAVVELYGLVLGDKPGHAFFTDTVSRASDVASTALSLLERLARFADEKHDGQHVPPVIAITSIRSDIKVWLAYCEHVDEQLRDHVRFSCFHCRKIMY